MISISDQKPKIIVIGDLMIDHYLWGTSDRISPEAPVQIINVEHDNLLLGGAGNVINNLKALGAEVGVLSVIGECQESYDLISLLKDINVDTKYIIRQKNRITSKKSRIIAEQQQVVRYDREVTDEIDSKTQDQILQIFNQIIENFDLILLSDYGKGVLTPDLVKSLIKISNKNKKRILVDPKGLDYSKYKGAYILTPNKKEASEATGVEIKDKESLLKAITILKDNCNLNVSLITLSDEGVAVFDDNLRIHPTSAREVYDVTGAGDTVLASIGFALACNNNIDDAVKFANLAAGVVVGKIGSATATINEIIEYKSSINKSSSDQHIKSLHEIQDIALEQKNKGRKIIFTNGCFDILHIGHIKYLEESKRFGDILILGLNSDKSVKRIKGPNRPINSQDDRAYLLASLEVVDFVVIFEEDTPINLIKQIKPDVLVKGGDYEGKTIVGQDIAKDVKLVKFIDGKSTTNTIEKISNI